MAERIGVVVMAYGTPARNEDIEAYYTHIRRGRSPEPAQLAELTARYDALGGTSPLAQRTRAQRDAIAAALEAQAPGAFVVELGQKHAAPFIEDAVASLAAAGVDRVIGMVFAPHYSGASVGQYHARAGETASEHNLAYEGLDSWYDLDAYVEYQATALRTTLSQAEGPTKVLFTAHSLPERALVDDPYPDQLRRGAELVAERVAADVNIDWDIAWQSAGRTPEPWRGPDILEVIEALAAGGDMRSVVVVPHGFTSDHLEVLYDVDIEAAGRAESHGLRLARPEVVNADAAVMGSLAQRLIELAR